MRSVLIERRQARRNALRPLALNPDHDRIFFGQVLTTGREAELLALPFWNGEGIEPQQALQDGAGNLGFMVGVSAVSGADRVL